MVAKYNLRWDQISRDHQISSLILLSIVNTVEREDTT